MKKNFYLSFTLFIALLFYFQKNGYSQNYTPLFTDATFNAKSIDVTLPVGAISGHAEVSNGAASYTIPIQVPIGTNGVVPDISLVYNSLAGNGPLGQGWDLVASSSITRIGKNIFQDGVVGSVNLDINDKFALDGKRLIVKSGVYAEANSIYTLEVENFSLTTAYGNLGGGPEYFKVESKDGTIMEYGNSVDSKLLNDNGTKVLSWHLNKVTNKDGNYIQYVYTNDYGCISLYQIRYTGNTNLNILPYNVILFGSDSRTDINTIYKNNKSITCGSLKNKILIYTNYNFQIHPSFNRPIKSYILNYGYNKTASYLNEILEKDSFDVIKNSTIFKYGENLINYQKVQPVGLQNESVDIFPADLNADGYSDLIALTRVRNGNEISYSNFKVLMKTPNSSSNNYTTLQPYNLPSNYIAYVGGGRTSNKNFVNDFNGDGQSDLLFGKTESNQFKEIAIFESTNNGNTFSSPTIILPTIYPQSSAKLENIGPNGNWIISGDFSGDGRTDVITFLTWPSGGGQTQIMLGGTNFFYSPVFNGLVTFGTINWHNAKSVSVVDFNGDGRDDIMLIGENECEIQTYNHGTNSFQRIYFTSYFGYPTKYDLIYQGDFNGDGKTDFLTRGSKTDNNYSWNIGKSTGVNIVTTSFTFDQTPNITNYYNDQILISDYNGDGKSDIAHMWFSGSQTNSKIDIYYSNGNSFYKEQTSYNDRFLSEPGLNFTLDFDADGRSDIFNRNFIGNPTFDILIRVERNIYYIR